jgi:hypothetical protein
VTPIYIRPTIIAVKRGNPKHIRRFEDLLRDGMRIVVTEGAGIATPPAPAPGKMSPVGKVGSRTSSDSARTSSVSEREVDRAIECL